MRTKILPRMRLLTLNFFLLALFCSCSEQSPCKDCEKCGENLEYNLISQQNFTSSDKVETKLDTMVIVDEEFVENKMKIEQKFGEQWDFCRCVLANDSLDRLIKNNAELDDNFMEAFNEVDQKCKAFLVMSPNKTPEERNTHENKIKNCLKATK